MRVTVSGQSSIASLLLDLGAKLNEANLEGNSALIAAAYHGKTDLARLLVEKGADLEQRNAQGFTALLVAATQGYAAILTLLLSKGADINATDRVNVRLLSRFLSFYASAHLQGNTALHCAAYRNHVQALEALLDHDDTLNVNALNLKVLSPSSPSS